MLIRDRLDTAFEAEPPEIPVEDRLAAGRSALRRRRVGQGAASVAAVALICTGAVAIAGRGPEVRERLEPSHDRVQATPSTPESTNEGDDGSDDGAAKPWQYPGQLAYVDATGALHVAPRARVIEKVPVRVPAGASVEGDVELAVAVGTKVWWVSISYENGKAAVPNQLVGPFQHHDKLRFQDFVLARRLSIAPQASSSTPGDPAGSGISANLQLVRFDSAGKLVPDQGVTILQQRPDPNFTNFAPPGANVGVAEVRDREGTRWFVIVRSDVDGTGEDIAAPPGVGEVPDTFDAFISWAQHKFDSGEGLL